MMNTQALKEIIIDQQSIDLPDEFITRAESTGVWELQTLPQIVIIAGIRRCGKSTLLQELRSKAQEASYYLNFDDERLINFRVEDFQNLFESFIELFGVQKTFYFDEIQNISQWEVAIRRLYEKKNKIYITGSNATMFSKELGTRLTGRYVQLAMYPFSFKEYVFSKLPSLLHTSNYTTEEKGQLRQLFANFINVGGFPEYIAYAKKAYLDSLYESIIYRDIIARYGVNESAIKELVFYLASNIAKEITYNSLKKLLSLASASTVSDYCSYLEQSFLCFFVKRFDYSLKKQQLYARKVYFIDHVLAKTVGFRVSMDHGRMLENIVFLELKRRYKEVYYYKGNKECDFLVKEGVNIIMAVQVAQHVGSEETKKREFAGLLEALEAYNLNSGIIITENERGEESIEYNQKHYIIRIVSIWQWLVRD